MFSLFDFDCLFRWNTMANLMKRCEWAKGMGQNLSFFCVCVVENLFMSCYKVIKYDLYTRLMSYLSFWRDSRDLREENHENKADKCFSFVRFKGYETKHS